MMKLTVGELAEQVDRAENEGDRARWKTVLRDDFFRWAKKNKRKEHDPMALKGWKSEPATSGLIIKCRI